MLVVGLGAAGVAVTKMMLASGVTHIVGCDRRGALSTRPRGLRRGRHEPDQALVRGELKSRSEFCGQPADVIEGMDLFIGLSGPGIIPAEALAKMNEDAIVFAMANPNPEVMPEDAAPYVRIMATGRSDYPNQINNVLCFPGIFRGALDAGAPRITEEMKLAAAKGIAEVVTEDDLSEDYIIPSVFNREVAPKVAAAVVEEARRDGIARFSEETGTFSTVEAMPAIVRVLITGASGLIGSRGLRCAGEAGRSGGRPQPRPRGGRAGASRLCQLAGLGADARTSRGRGLRGRRRGDQPARGEDQPALE